MNNTKNITILAFIGITTLIAISGLVNATYEYDYYSDDAWLWGGLGLAACGIWIIIWFVIFILIAIWVYRDAEKRGSSGALWLIVVIILGIIGLIIWLIVRPPIGGKKEEAAKPERRCPNCGRVIPDDARTCPYCSKKFEE
jgi:hypothetical protein